MIEREGENRHPELQATDGLTPEEDRQLVQLLARWTGGRISTPVFTELAQMTPQAIVEVVLFRMRDATLETLLIPRPDDDILWPGMVHTPGTALRRSDFLRDDVDPLNSAFERIQQGELNYQFSYAPFFAGRLYRFAARGAEVAEIYVTQLPDGTALHANHQWFPVVGLSENTHFIQGQLGHVILAAEKFMNR